MWEKSMRVLVSGVLSLSLMGNTTVLATVNNPTHIQENENIAQNYLKVSYESKILFHEQVPTKTMIQVLNENNDVVESNVLTSDKEMNLEEPKVSKGKMLSYWFIEMKDKKLLIKPVLTKKEEYSAKFYVKDGGGNLIENHAQIKEIVKSATKNTTLKDVLPDVNPDANYKFAGWFETTSNGDEKVEDIDERKITDSKNEYYAKFYSDFNNNDIDDNTEEITVNFVTNIEEQVEPVKVNVGKKIETPKLSSKDKIFMGWYTNPELTNKFSDENLKESITLYAKWEDAEKVITESETKPITDEDVSNQVENILNERFAGLESNQPTDNNNGNSETNHTKNNNSGGVTPATSNSLGRVETPRQNSSNVKDDVALNGSSNSDNSNSNKVSVYTEKKFVFKNKNVNEIYMVKFYKESGAFVSSVTLPYGRTLKLFDENENLYKEYAVRQDTSITLNTEKYVNKDSTFLGLETRIIDVNSSEVTEIHPTVGKNRNSSSFLYKHDEKKEQEKDTTTQILIITLSAVAVICIILGTLLLFKKRKKKEQNQNINT